VFDRQLRSPAEKSVRGDVVGIPAAHITEPRFILSDDQSRFGHRPEEVQHFENGGAVAGAEVYRYVPGVPTCGKERVESTKRAHMGLGEIPYVHVVANTAAIAGRPISAGPPEFATGGRRFDELVEQAGGSVALRTGSQMWVGADPRPRRCSGLRCSVRV